VIRVSRATGRAWFLMAGVLARTISAAIHRVRKISETDIVSIKKEEENKSIDCCEYARVAENSDSRIIDVAIGRAVLGRGEMGSRSRLMVESSKINIC